MKKIGLYLSNWQMPVKDVVTSIILAIIIIVVAVPEGLPMMIANVLSQNMNKLLNDNVLVRKLLGIETAGSMNLLFVDKTGTITEGKFMPILMVDGSGHTFYSCRSIPNRLGSILSFALNESTNAQYDNDKGIWIGGNASDRALLTFLNQKKGTKKETETETETEPEIEKLKIIKPIETQIIQEILFNSKHKFSAVHISISKDINYISKILPHTIYNTKSYTCTIIKGAPEIILSHTNHYIDSNGQERDLESATMSKKIKDLSSQGLRFIAIAMSSLSINSKNNKKLPDKMCLIGIIGIKDSIRPDATSALKECKGAGIQVIMLTGDKKETADAVARQVGLLEHNHISITSEQLASMDDKTVSELLPRLAVVSRALPTDKSRLVKIGQNLGKVVGMTGDGVNDAPALKSADIGFAMGNGSEVAKEASDVVIMGNNFKSITQSILFGRTIFKSIRKFIIFQATVGISAIIITFLGPFLGFAFPLTLIQLLWVNLVMDTLAAISFGGEAPGETTMKEAPIPRDEAMISPAMWKAIISGAIFIAIICIAFLTLPIFKKIFAEPGTFLTAFFSLFIFLTAFNSFNVRTPGINIFKDIYKNPGFILIQSAVFIIQILLVIFGGTFMRTVPISIYQWFITFLLSFSIIPFDVLRKFLYPSSE